MTSLVLSCSADWHIGDLTQFSEIDDTGRPSRLLQFKDLTSDFFKFGLDNNADASVIAGDIVDQPVIRPMVADVLDYTVDNLSSRCPLILTHGQHDLDTKTEDVAVYHSALARFKKKHNNIVYADSPSVVHCKGHKIVVAPWRSDYALPDLEGDVFIGHGMVQGCVNSDGYEFHSGFDQKELFKRFRLSIIGDIHNGQVYFDKDRKILIPGSPIQFNYKDAPVTGFWLCSVKPGFITCEFTPIEKLRPNFYHRFLHTDDPEVKSSGLVHYRYKAPTTRTSPRLKTEFKKDTNSVTEIGLSVIKQSKINNQELVSDIFSKLMESLPSTDRKVPRSKIHSLEVHNFLSVEDFTLDMKEFSDNLVLTGKNGSGKSSLVEAIYWCLTGSTTKGVKANDVKNFYAEMGTFVVVILEIEGVMYKIGRGRTDGPQLQIFMFTDKWTPYTGNRTSITQDTIYELLGISEWEIKLLSYFPAKNPSLFGSIGKSDRYSLLSTIVGMSAVDAARDRLGEMIKDNADMVSKVGSKVQTLRMVGENCRTKISGYISKRDSQGVLDTTKLETEKTQIEANLKQLATSRSLIQEIDACGNKLASLTGQKTVLENDIKNRRTTFGRLSKEIEDVKTSLRTSLDGKCPTCLQPLQNDDVINNLTARIEGLRSQLPDPAGEKALLGQLAESDTQRLSVGEQMVNLRASLAGVQRLEDRLAAVNAGLADARDRRGVDYEPLIQAETENLEAYNKEITQEEARFSGLAHLQDAMAWVQKTLLKRNGLLISELAKQGQKLLQDQVNLLTDGESFNVIIEDDLSVAATFLGRQKCDYDQLSTGQARVVDIVMMVGLNNLFTQMYGLDSGVLGVVIFDEVLSFLDPAYSDYCFQLINRANVPKKIVITHDLGLISKFGYEIKVSLERTGSSVYSKSWGGRT